jgi:hypothetical protein
MDPYQCKVSYYIITENLPQIGVTTKIEDTK